MPYWAAAIVSAARRHPAGEFGEGGVARTGERARHRHRAEVEPAVVGDGALADVHACRGRRAACSGVAMSRSMAAPAVMILNVDPGGYRPVVASGPSLSAAAFCATARISPVDGLITTIIAFLPVVLTAFCAAFCTARSRLMVTEGAGAPGTSLSTSTSAPFWLTLTTRQPASPSSSSTTAFLTWLTMSGANESSVGSSSACGVMTTPGRAPIAAGHPVVVGLAQRDQAQRLLRRAGLLGEPLRVQGVVERPQRVDHGPGGRHQRAACRLRVQRVVVQIAGHQHVGAAALVDRRPPRRVGAQRERLVLAELAGATRLRSSGPPSGPRRGPCSAGRRRSRCGSSADARCSGR